MKLIYMNVSEKAKGKNNVGKGREKYIHTHTHIYILKRYILHFPKYSVCTTKVNTKWL